MYKKSQVTLFIILAVVILVVAGLIIYSDGLKSEKIESEIKKSNPELLPVKNYVDSCLEETLKKGANFLSFQGGYYYPSDNSINLDPIMVPVYVDFLEKDSLPSEQMLDIQLSFFVAEKLKNCVGNFEALSEIGFEVTEKEPLSVEFTITEQDITANLKYPLEIKKGETVNQITDFYSKIEHPLLKLYSLALEAKTIIESNPTGIPVSELIQFGSEKNVYVGIFDQMNGEVMYSLVHNYQEPEELFFNFGAKYSASATVVSLLKTIPSQKAYPGYEFNYKIESEVPNVKFTDHTSLFDISPEGKIKFTPSSSDKGIHNILVKAEDSQGNIDYSYLNLEIIHDNPPSIENIPDQIVRKGQTFTYQVKATDPDDDTLFYSIQGLPTDSIHPTTGLITYTADQATETQITVNVKAVDINTNIATESFKLKVEE